MILITTACGPGQVFGPTLTPTPTVTLTPTSTPTATPTPTPTPTHTPTPTITPTPIGGRSGLLLHERVCKKRYEPCASKLYTYDINTHRVSSFLEGYEPVGISPNGKKAALTKTENGKTDLFVADLANPQKMDLLYENIKYVNLRDATWLPETDWIGFISIIESKKQVFIIHPDGSGLTQVTHSSIGAVRLEPAFNNGVFWGEGIIPDSGGGTIYGYKWTKLDGTEVSYTNFVGVSTDGKVAVEASDMMVMGNPCFYCNIILIDTESGERKEISLPIEFSISDPSVFSEMGSSPMKKDQWIVEGLFSDSDKGKYFIYTQNGQSRSIDLLTDFYNRPDENADYYDLIGYPFFWNISPDGKKTVIKRVVYTKEPYSTEESYFLLDLETFETQPLPNLEYTYKDGTAKGFAIVNVFWIELQ